MIILRVYNSAIRTEVYYNHDDHYMEQYISNEGMKAPKQYNSQHLLD